MVTHNSRSTRRRLLVVLVFACAMSVLASSPGPQRDRQACEKILLELPDDSDCYNVRLTAQPLLKMPEEEAERVLTSVIRERSACGVEVVRRAVMCAGLIYTPEVKREIHTVLRDPLTQYWIRQIAAESAALAGDASAIPLIVQEIKDGKTAEQRGRFVGALSKFDELAIPHMRELAQTGPMSGDLWLLSKLVILNDPWAVAELKKSKYDSAGNHAFRRLAYWRRECRLRRQKRASEGESVSVDESMPSHPPKDWKAPFER